MQGFNSICKKDWFDPTATLVNPAAGYVAYPFCLSFAYGDPLEFLKCEEKLRGFRRDKDKRGEGQVSEPKDQNQQRFNGSSRSQCSKSAVGVANF